MTTQQDELAKLSKVQRNHIVGVIRKQCGNDVADKLAAEVGGEALINDDMAAELWRLYLLAGKISGSALLAGERCPTSDKAALYEIACTVLNGIGGVYSDVTGSWPNLEAPHKAVRPQQAARVPQWFPIETAPKDGTPHLRALQVDRSGFIFWEAHAGRINDETGEFQDLGGEYTGWDADDYTHWTPLLAWPDETTQTPPPGHIVCLTCDGKGYQPIVDPALNDGKDQG